MIKKMKNIMQMPGVCVFVKGNLSSKQNKMGRAINKIKSKIHKPFLAAIEKEIISNKQKKRKS